uniref:NADH dehydrogenase [ubiquinone] 1 beta subcomplex subunit 4 n=1 Tax=Oryctolagus cuniculus TaxID=9986 RepID=A0A5F9CRW5_RABIT
MSFSKYKPPRLATLPSTLDPAEYDISPETQQAQAERLAIRSRLKREYLLQYNDPSRRGLIILDKKGKLIREGKLDRTFNISY